MAAPTKTTATTQTRLLVPPSPPPSLSDSHSNCPDDVDTDAPEYTPSFPLPPPASDISPLAIDKDTPDAWVPRDPRLIRLTGLHPFNVEAPLTALFDAGFITPTQLFYVRNHGAVPQILDDDIPDWTITVEGLVERPLSITLRQLLQDFEQVTAPITMVCAGNRRKEQNIVRKTKGFSWGAAGVSTAIWTGCMLADVIAAAKPLKKARYVCMEGADRLPNGYYGTSVKLVWVRDPARGIMLAHKMNREMLTPDHGRPLRVVIPGQIGGRSVKWLKRLIITEGPSDNWYHIYDNRVLPTMVTPEMSSQDKSWWTDERYAIYDLSTNSAIAYPQHDETLDLRTAPAIYTAHGYAYSGGGRRISRVELSIDSGDTWRLATITYPEDRYRAEEYEGVYLFGGKLDMSWRDSSHCWCFWSLQLDTKLLAKSDGFLLRAMDESMNLQPRDMYWSVLGMMNNPWFRVAIIRDGDILRFEHPTQPALLPGGWMERVKKAGGNPVGPNWGESTNTSDETPFATRTSKEPTEPSISMTNSSITRVIEYDELKAHQNAEKPWIVINGEVYDPTPYLDEHPGGAISITAVAGTDASDEFLTIHSETAKAMMKTYHVGTLSPAAATALTAAATVTTTDNTTAAPVFLNAKFWQTATLVEKTTVSSDTRCFKFTLHHDTQTLGLPVGQHVLVRVKDPTTSSRDVLIRSYTPISDDSIRGTFTLLVKIYFAAPSYPGGKMTLALDALKLGATIDVKGPIGKMIYKGRGVVAVNGVERRVRSLYMICAGSGVTPILQVLRAVVQDGGDETRCVVLDGNRTEEDILCRGELDAFAAVAPQRCRIVHTLSRLSESWKGLTGRIDRPLIAREMPQEGPVMALVCGPPALETSVRQILRAEGFEEQDMLFF
ncbi:hypothetical protein TWF696_006762 [Orbilia brochopaga]|uniref:Nitrate reductase n=1 Tax=Orbilia brochopaga TaxID=3140254 RepID=A0AAV9UT43_9PEZI